MIAEIGIDCLSIFGLPPVQFIELAADLGCSFITLGLPVSCNPENFSEYTYDDPLVRGNVKAALRHHGIRVKSAEGFFFLPEMDRRSYARKLDHMADIGSETVNMVSIDKDLSRSLDHFAELAEIAASYGMSSSVEFVAGTVIGTLADAEKVVRHVGRTDFTLVVDVMHLARSGGDSDDLLEIDPSLIGYIQLCDCRRESADPTYEARFERMPPGAGELPLAEILSALPLHRPIGLEIPQRSLAEAGIGPRERLKQCVEAAKVLLTNIEASSMVDSSFCRCAFP